MVVTVVTPAQPAQPKKPKASKATKPAPKEAVAVKRPAPSHPPTSQMVTAAITSLKERGGSSLQAIKKYIAVTFNIDSEKVAPFIRRYLRTAVADGTLVQTKGTGANGSFKLAAGATAKKSEKTKTVKPASEGTSAGRKAVKPEKVAKKTVAAKKTTSEKPKSVKEATKTPTAKKTAAKKAAPKKTTAKKA